MNNFTGGVKNRRKSALQRLEEQLVKGVKHVEPKNLVNLPNPNDVGDGTLPLTDLDVKRIEKEISILKTKI